MAALKTRLPLHLLVPTLLGLTLLGCPPPPPPQVNAVLVGGTVVADAGGAVEVVREGSARSATRGFVLEPGDTVRTGPDGRAVLLLEEGAVEVLVFENSEVVLGSIFAKVGKVVVRVLKKVKDKFEVESEYGVATAETTEFLVSVGPGGDYRCAVIEGRVRVRSPTGEWMAMTLARGEEATGRPGIAAQRRELSREQYNGLVLQVNEVERLYRPRDVRLVVPEVTGLPEAEARRALLSAGLEVGAVRGEVSDRAPLGTVLLQTPSAGTRLRGAGRVALVVAAEATTVPRVTALPLDDAERRLSAARLRVGEVERRMTGERPEGEVLRQSPAAGAELAEGSAVDLWVEAPSVEVPPVHGVPARQALAVLEQAGLRFKVERRLVEGERDDVVLELSPAPGTRVAPGSLVRLVIAERGVRVPSLTGATRRVVAATLERTGLALGRVSERPARERAGTIVDQQPRPGALVRPGTRVDVVVSASCRVPNLYEMSRDEALRTLEEAGLTGRVEGVGRYNRETVFVQRPKAGTEVRCGAVVYLTLGTDIG